MAHLRHSSARRVGGFLERQGLVERDAENRYLCIEAALVINKTLTHIESNPACGAAPGQLVRLIEVRPRE